MNGVSFKKSYGGGKLTGGDDSEATSSATPRQTLGVDTMDLHDRGHCVHLHRVVVVPCTWQTSLELKRRLFLARPKP